MDLYLDRISHPVMNLGPGRRIGLWVQGCRMACPGCMTPELFAAQESARVSTEKVAARIISLATAHDGLTVSGGEPFDQPEALSELLATITAATTLDVFVYTGYRIEDLRLGSLASRRLLEQIDVLMDGPFIRELPGTKLWRGSDNQRMHLLSERATRYECFREARYAGPRELHIEVTETGTLHLVGIPERGFDSSFSASAESWGVQVKKRSR